MAKGKWIPVHFGTERQVKHEMIRGIDVELYLSPYDIPEAVRGGYDSKAKRFIVEFKYLGDENTKSRKSGIPHIDILIGRNSGRLYAIEIDVDTLKADAVRVTVCQVLDKLVRDPIEKDRLDNYRLAKEVVALNEREIFEQAAL